MKIHPLIAAISLLSLAIAQDCNAGDKEDQTWSFVKQKVMPLLGLALTFPAGLGPFHSLGMSTISYFLDKILPDHSQNRPDPLKELAVELSNRMDRKLDNRTIDLFTQYAGNARQFYGNYKKAYDTWQSEGRPAKESESYSLYNYYVNQMGFLEQGPNYMAASKFTYLALPQFVIMASAHLSILRDAAMIGNDYLSVTSKPGSKTDFRQQFQFYLKKYSDILLSNYNARLDQLFHQQHGNSFTVKADAEYRKAKRSQELFNIYVAYETTNVLTAFDVTKCDSYNDRLSNAWVPKSYCNVNIEWLRRFKNIGKPYKGLLKKIRPATLLNPIYAAQEASSKGPLGFTRFWFQYEDGSTYATPSAYHYHDERLYSASSDGPIPDFTDINTMSTINITYAKINNDFSCSDKPCYVFTGLNFGNTPMTLPPKCPTINEKLDIPDGHIFSGMYPVGNKRPDNNNFYWEIVFTMEYRKKNRVDFAGLTSSHGIRFPADYVRFQERIKTNDYGEMSYLLGGRSIKFPGDVVFGLPSRNQGFDFNLRVYAKNNVTSMTIDGCVLTRRGVQFDGFDIYDGDCQQQKVTLPAKITVSGPLHLGAIEVVQMKSKA
ncbi:hypothetical protein BGW38_005263 [Lunasporangiospora selenospora]|uniref:Pesticidal crystal protein domain-containing protein n=1 Tax=Lunasporangiospora selenospora TaxID=979761 RepID=A0A9P6FPE3_9FUNG|nr:hypothetical protein BGW38_005263 [Lunasporangiospora selenospora]